MHHLPTEGAEVTRCPICGDEVEVASDGFVLDLRRLKRGWGQDPQDHKMPADVYFDCVGQGAFVEHAE